MDLSYEQFSLESKWISCDIFYKYEYERRSNIFMCIHHKVSMYNTYIKFFACKTLSVLKR